MINKCVFVLLFCLSVITPLLLFIRNVLLCIALLLEDLSRVVVELEQRLLQHRYHLTVIALHVLWRLSDDDLPQDEAVFLLTTNN